MCRRRGGERGAIGVRTASKEMLSERMRCTSSAALRPSPASACAASMALQRTSLRRPSPQLPSNTVTAASLLPVRNVLTK